MYRLTDEPMRYSISEAEWDADVSMWEKRVGRVFYVALAIGFAFGVITMGVLQ